MSNLILTLKKSALRGCAISLLAAFPLAAQAEEDDLIILDDELVIEDKLGEADWQKEFFDFVDRYVYGRVGGSGFFGSSTSHYAAIEVGVDYTDDSVNVPFPVRGVAQLIAYTTASTLELEYDPDDASTGREAPECPTPTGTPSEQDGEECSVDLEGDGVDLRLAFIEAEPLPNLIFTAGRQSPIWGQFDLLSPVNLLLPVELRSNNFGFSKDTYRRPQDAVSLNWFPNERFEVQGWYFPTVRLDPLVEELVEHEGNFFVSGDSAAARALREETLDRIDGYDSFAVRLLHYNDYFTLGLTYFDGHQALAPFDMRRINVPDPLLDVVRTDRAFVDFPEMQAYGFELSVPYGQWNIRAEAIFYEGPASLLCCEYAGATNAAQKKYYEWIRDGNDGDDHLLVDQLIAALGFDGQHENWSFGLAVVYVGNLLTDKAKEARDLEDDAFPNDDSEIDLTAVLPTAYLFYRFDEEGTQTAGLAAGFLGPAAGASLFYTGRWRDDITWWLSGDVYFNQLTDQTAAQGQYDDAGWDLKGDAIFGVRTGLTYSF